MPDGRPEDLLEIGTGIYRVTKFYTVDVVAKGNQLVAVQLILYLDPKPKDLAVGDNGCVCVDNHLFDCSVVKVGRTRVWVNNEGPVRLVAGRG